MRCKNTQAAARRKNVLFLRFTRKNIRNARSLKSNRKKFKIQTQEAARKRKKLLQITLSLCLILVPCWWSKCSALCSSVIHKISHCSQKRYILNSLDQIWIYVYLYCENNIKRTHVHDHDCGKKSFNQTASRILDYHKTSSNFEVHEEIVHVEKSNYGEVSLGPSDLRLWTPNSTATPLKTACVMRST